MKGQALVRLVQEEVQEVVTGRGLKLLDKVYLLLILDIRVLMRVSYKTVKIICLLNVSPKITM